MGLFERVKAERPRFFLKKLGLKESDFKKIICKKRVDEVFVTIPTVSLGLSPEELETFMRIQRPGPRKRKRKSRDPRYDAIAGLRALSRNKAIDTRFQKVLKKKADELKGWKRLPWERVTKKREIVVEMFKLIESGREKASEAWGVEKDFSKRDTIILISAILGMEFKKINSIISTYLYNK